VSTHKTVDNKAPDRILPYSDNTLFRNKAANSGLKAFLLKKQINITDAVLESGTERLADRSP